ncbi:hypothetical protein B0H16DRAFT_1613470 [Mycena metata]|uniref:CFEM domain-containing protein n=1 Tax=Mycena metata TaxID=1033252 RepID=A0AAD7MGJ5_9AGAR|nr:hypothetical protein B0H16DRAFT_1613470 [Mycena metata]
MYLAPHSNSYPRCHPTHQDAILRMTMHKGSWKEGHTSSSRTMRFTTVFATLSLLTSVSAAHYPRQAYPGFPTDGCADNCLNNPSNLGGCSQSDLGCLCKSLPFIQSTFACIQTACQGADQQTAVNGAESLCLNFGVTLAAESSAIVAGLPSASSGASITGSGTQGTSSTPPAPTNTGSARQLSTGYILGTMAAMGIAGVLSLY